MRVFLGNSPWSAEGLFGVRAGSRWPHFENKNAEYMPFPFFLAYATAVLEARGVEALLVDGIAEKLDDQAFYDRILAFKPGLVLLEVSTSSIQTDERHWKHVRRMLGPDAKIALSGIHALMQEPAWLKQHPEVDFVLVGEYDYTLRDLSLRLEKGEGLDGIDGLIYRGRDGEPTWTGKRPLVMNLDELPWPARHFLPMYDYRDEPGSIPRPSVQMWASRGCPYRCSFCAWPQIMYGGFKYRTRQIVDVIDETEWLVHQWGFKSVYYDDDTFNIGKKRMLDFCAEFKRRQLKIPWAIMARIDGMDEEVLEAMADSGLAALKYGVESADQGIVDRCGKRLDVSKVRQVVGHSHSLGIKTHLTFMFGLPGETRESAKRTIDLALELMPESLQFTLATPFPGSALFKQLEKEGKIRTSDYSQYDGFHTAVVSTDDLSSKDLEEILADANARWCARYTKRTFATTPAAAEGAAPRAPRDARAGCDEDDGAPAASGGAVPDERPRPPRPLCTVVIPNYNGETVLRDCLASLKRQTHQPLQIVVVDDASTDQSVLIAEQYFDGVEVIRRPKNSGFAATVNAGIKAARGKFIALLNNDTKAEEGWIASSLDVFGRMPDVGAVAPKILTFDLPVRVYAVGIGVTRSGYAFNIGQGTLEDGTFNQGRYVLGASGAGAVFRREVFEIVGGFDEDLAHYLEDVDLALRAQLEGIRCYYEPGAVIQHWGGAAIGGQNAPLMVKQVSRNLLGILLKDVPRSLLAQQALRIGGALATLQAYHTLAGRGVASAEGFLEGIKLGGQMVAKRKRILGHQKVPDQRVLELMLESETFLRETAALLPKLSRLRLRLMAMA
jgi:anaerobic magnesium-protoporphyrin IX monomethyl ester cyclase